LQDNDIKENFSDGFFRILMAKNRLKIHKPDSDDGVDLNVAPVEKNERKTGEITYSDSDRMLGIQLKCTTQKNLIEKKNGNYSYKIKIKNYEDLVRSKAKGDPYKALILVVFILPDEEDDWLLIYDDYIKLSKHAFWYYPCESDTLQRSEKSKLDSTISIEIKALNKMTADFLQIYKSFYENTN
jgi:hypothetical protein